MGEDLIKARARKKRWADANREKNREAVNQYQRDWREKRKDEGEPRKAVPKSLPKSLSHSPFKGMFTHHNDRVRRAKWARLVELHGEPERCEICEDQILKANGTSGANWDHDKRLDHLPEADQFRGWLCGSCNRAIGLLKDSPLAALKAAEYLKMHEERRNALLMRYKVAQDEHDMLRCFL